jgi:uncharacterized protein (TIGR02118 family)
MDRRTMLVASIASATALRAGSSARGQDRALTDSDAGPTPVKLIAIYERPDDPEAFFQHYETVHAPLVRKTPGLQSLVLNRVAEDMLGGEPPYLLIAEMTYPDRPTFDAAMKSRENQAAGQDLMTFAKGKVRILVTEGMPV